MKVKFDFVIESWLKDVVIEANDLDDAKEKLLRMSLDDLIKNMQRYDDAGYVDDSTFKDIDYEIIAKDFKVKVTNVQYDKNDFIDDTDYENALETLPKEFVFEFEDIEVDLLEGYISDYIWDETGFFAQDFDFEVIGESNE